MILTPDSLDACTNLKNTLSEPSQLGRSAHRPDSFALAGASDAPVLDAPSAVRPSAPRRIERHRAERRRSVSAVLWGLWLGAACATRGAAALSGGFAPGARNCVPYATRDIANISYGILACASDSVPSSSGSCGGNPWCGSYGDNMLQSSAALLTKMQAHTSATGPGTHVTDLYLGRISDNSAFVYTSAVDLTNDAQNFIRSQLNNANDIGF